MPLYLGIDTSNYTTSVALYDSQSGEVWQAKQLLTVSGDAVGLRQSDAVFAHIKQLSTIVASLCEKLSKPIDGVCVSAFPRSAEGSYMPCFLVGKMVAESIAAVNKMECSYCSHQEGHVVAAAFSAGKLSLLKEEFYAFHISGGTTECLLIKPKDDLFEEEILAKTLDINAGQLIDRTGVMLGLSFPCGRELDRLSRLCDEEIKIRTSVNGLDCNLSGFQNKTQMLKAEGKSDEYIAKYAIEAVRATLLTMEKAVTQRYGKRPILYAGGVMSNSIIRSSFEKDGVFFADPEFSSDNATGVAIIGSMKMHRKD